MASRSWRWLLGAWLVATSARAETAPAVVVLREPSVAGDEIIEELKIHVHRSHPLASFEARSAGATADEHAAALAQVQREAPAVAVLLGPAVAASARAPGWGGVRRVVGAVGEHEVRSASDEVAVVAEGCPVDALLVLARKLRPDARRIGWLRAGDQAGGALEAALRASSEARGLAVEPLDLASLPTDASQAPEVLLQAAREVDPTKRSRSAAWAQRGGRLLVACDRDSVAAGASAGLTTDAQQTGEALGEAVAAALDGRTGRWRRVEMGAIAVNVRSACAAGARVTTDVLARAQVFERGEACAPPPPPPPSRAPWVALGLGAAVGSWLALGRRGRAGRGEDVSRARPARG